MFIVDYLKNIKSSWNNDFAAYKRAKSNLKQVDTAETVENQDLYMFLANQNTVTFALRKSLAAIDHYKDLLILILQVCVCVCV
jgi:hypothetical protein